VAKKQILVGRPFFSEIRKSNSIGLIYLHVEVGKRSFYNGKALLRMAGGKILRREGNESC
jgi:hypothetical protein